MSDALSKGTESDLSKQDKKFAKLPQETKAAIDAEDKAALVARLSHVNNEEFTAKKAMDEDEKIGELKEELKELKGPYQDVIKGAKLMREYINTKLEEQGAVG